MLSFYCRWLLQWGGARTIIAGMKLESIGILISMRPFGERDVVARVFTRDFGVMCGTMRAVQVMTRRKPLVGQIGNVAWNARLDSQLGAFHWDATTNPTAPIMMSAKKLALFNSAFDLISVLLPEREQYRELYDETVDFVKKLAISDDDDGAYLNWEMVLLRELGYALDLSHCSGCGSRDNLHFLSPRTGRAVCDNCAAPYIGRLYELPPTLTTTLHFIENICTAQGADIPLSRRRLGNK